MSCSSNSGILSISNTSIDNNNYSGCVAISKVDTVIVLDIHHLDYREASCVFCSSLTVQLIFTSNGSSAILHNAFTSLAQHENLNIASNMRLRHAFRTVETDLAHWQVL